MEAAKSSLKQELRKLQKLREQPEICTLKSQLAACNYELHQEAAEERLKEEMETFKGNLSIQSCKLKLI